MARDIEAVIAGLEDSWPGVRVEQLRVLHAADDDGLWFVSHPDSRGKVQVESSSGTVPFLVEADGVPPAWGRTMARRQAPRWAAGASPTGGGGGAGPGA